MSLSKDQILAANDRRTLDVEVPEWGGSVKLAVMSGTERESYEREWTATDDKLMRGYKMKLLRRCIVDDANQSLFSDADLASLGNKNGTVLDRLFQECMKLNGFLKDSVEEAAKN